MPPEASSLSSPRADSDKLFVITSDLRLPPPNQFRVLRPVDPALTKGNLDGLIRVPTEPTPAMSEAFAGIAGFEERYRTAFHASQRFSFPYDPGFGRMPIEPTGAIASAFGGVVQFQERYQALLAAAPPDPLSRGPIARDVQICREGMATFWETGLPITVDAAGLACVSGPSSYGGPHDTSYRLFTIAGMADAGSGVVVDGSRVAFQDLQLVAVREQDITALDRRPGNYYCSAVDGKKTWALAGPFERHLPALLAGEEVKRIARATGSPSMLFASFGTLRIDSTTPPRGKLNAVTESPRIRRWLNLLPVEREVSRLAPIWQMAIDALQNTLDGALDRHAFDRPAISAIKQVKEQIASVRDAKLAPLSGLLLEHDAHKAETLDAGAERAAYVYGAKVFKQAMERMTASGDHSVVRALADCCNRITSMLQDFDAEPEACEFAHPAM